MWAQREHRARTEGNYHYAVSDSGSDREHSDNDVAVAAVDYIIKADHKADKDDAEKLVPVGELWTQTLQDEELEGKMATAGSIGANVVNDRGPESYNPTVSSSKLREPSSVSIDHGDDLFGEHSNKTEGTAAGTSTGYAGKSRKRKHSKPRYNQSKQWRETQHMSRNKQQFRKKDHPTCSADANLSDGENSQKRPRADSSYTEPDASKPSLQLDDDEGGDDWAPMLASEVTFNVRKKKTEPCPRLLPPATGSNSRAEGNSRWPRVGQTPRQQAVAPNNKPGQWPSKPLIPNDQKFCHPTLLRDDYSLEKLLATEIAPDMELKEMGLKMAIALGDLKPETIVEHVESLGKENAIAVFKRTQEKEASGGMNTNSNYRRRTPGGIFLFFAKEVLYPDGEQPPKPSDDWPKLEMPRMWPKKM